MKTTKQRKAIKIIVNVLTYIFFAACILSLIVSISIKKDSDGAARIFGMQIRTVLSDSMAKCDQTDVSEYNIKDIPVKSIIFIDLLPESKAKADEWYSKLKKGDVLTFRYVYVTQETITHRIENIYKNESGGYTIELSGDNKSSSADTLSQTIDTSKINSPNYVIGKVCGKSYILGLAVHAVKSPVGIVCIVIIPSIIIAVFEIIRLISVVNQNKKNREHEEKEKLTKEFEEMKRRLEELERQADQTTAEASETEKENSVSENNINREEER